MLTLTTLVDIHPRIPSLLSALRDVVKQADWDAPQASLLLPSDSSARDQALALRQRLGHSVRLLIVVGIGGSSLGAQAVLAACSPTGIPVMFCETIDAASLQRLQQACQSLVTQPEEVVILVISKSGTTTETVVIAQLLTQWFTARGLDVRGQMVAITDENSALWEYASATGIASIAIPARVGGRYSVLSAVGIVPAVFAGVDAESLLAGATAMRSEALQDDGPAAVFASWMLSAYTNGKIIHDLFVFDTRLASCAQWFRQLYAESLGKDGKGFLPTVSVGTQDLHSVAQVYLGGNLPLMTTMMTSTQPSSEPLEEAPFTRLVPTLSGHRSDAVLTAITDAVLQGYQAHAIPTCKLHWEAVDAYHTGAFFQLSMITVMLMGSLLEVNAFDQPNVEEYKAATRSLLAH